MTSSFSDLPTKVVELIFGFLEEKDQKSLALVSKAIYKIFQQFKELNKVELFLPMGREMINREEDECSYFKKMDERLKRYPNLKRLHLSFFSGMDSTEWNLEPFREFVDNWSTRLDEIEVNMYYMDIQLLKAFKEWNNEKLTYGRICLILDPRHMESIKWFFSHPRRIKRLETLESIKVLDEALFDIINRNATIDSLKARYEYIRSNSIPKVLYNVNGVKEIDLRLFCSPVDSGNFTPEALLKVTKFTDDDISANWENRSEFKLTDLPHFPNLRNLQLFRMIIFDDDMKCIVENFPNLEEILINDFHAYGGNIFSGLQSLKKIELRQARSLSDENLIVGFNLPNLTSLKIDIVGKVTLTGIKGFIANCPKLEKLGLGDAQTDDRMEANARFREELGLGPDPLMVDRMDDACYAFIKENFSSPKTIYYH